MLQRSNDPACRAEHEIRKIPNDPHALTEGGGGPRSDPAYAVYLLPAEGWPSG